MNEYLEPTGYLDSDHEAVREYARRATAGAVGERAQVRALFAAVRDGIRYDPYTFPRDPDQYKASTIAGLDQTFCVPKAVLLSAGARALGIPARLRFADVKNHLQSERLLQKMGTDLFVWHGYSELYVEGQWRKASPAFNTELCERFGVEALDFDGTKDAILHPFSGDGSRYMEYLDDHGHFVDMPYDQFVAAIDAAYPLFSDDAA